MSGFWRATLLGGLGLATATAGNLATAAAWDANGAVPPNGVFSVADNWGANVVPTGGKSAFFSLNDTYTVTFTGNQTSGSVALPNGHVTWLSDSATVRQYNVVNLVAGRTSR